MRQMQAIVLGAIGLLFASPIPKKIVAAMSPAHASSSNDMYVSSASRFWNIANDFFAPLVQVGGIGLVAFCVATLLIQGRHLAFRQPITPIALNYAIAGILAVFTATLVYISPPRVAWNEMGVKETVVRAQDAATGQTGWNGTGPEPAPTPTPTPTSPAGMTSW